VVISPTPTAAIIWCTPWGNSINCVKHPETITHLKGRYGLGRGGPSRYGFRIRGCILAPHIPIGNVSGFPVAIYRVFSVQAQQTSRGLSERRLGTHCGIPRQTKDYSFGNYLISESVSVKPPSVTEASLYSLERRVLIYDCYVKKLIQTVKVKISP
jgi:hypothetical protein